MNWKVKIFMLHLIRFRTKLKLQSYFTFPSCPVLNTAYGTRAKRTQSTPINQEEIWDNAQKEWSGNKSTEVFKKSFKDLG